MMIQAPADELEVPVVWEDPAHAELQWKWDDMHCPQPLPPLAADYMIRILSKGLNYYFQQAGQPIEWMGGLINGYAYYTTKLGLPDSERARINSEFQKYDRELSVGIRDYWDNEAFPALREHYEWLRTAPLETASPTALADLWEEAWKRAVHAWEIHFMTVAGCYQCLDSLIDLYELLFEGAGASEA